MKNKNAHIAIIAIFLLVTFGFSVLFFAMPKEDYSSSEKRYLADFPEFTLESFVGGKFTNALEGGENGGYIPDHFPLRSFFVGVNSYWNLLIGSTSSNGYYYADDGYIITKPSDVNNSERNLEIINKFSASFDEVVLMVVPSAGEVLSDKLPANSVDYPDEGVYANIEKYKADNIKFCDIRDEFRELYTSTGTQLFYKTDHHWTSAGAYAAYEKLCPELGKTAVTQESLTKSSFDNFYGTTYSSSGYFLRKPDTLEIWENKAADSVKVTIVEGAEEKSYDTMYFESHLEEDDMYPVFLDGNHALVTIENPKAESNETLLIIKDSFAHCATPFLANNYSKIVMVDMRYYKLPVTELAAQHGVDDVLFLYGMSNFCTDTNFGYLK